MPTQSATDILSENYRFLQEHVRLQVGIVIEGDKHYLFESRLSPIATQLGLGSVNDLCAMLRATRESALSRRVVEAMTTNETYFFRDPAHYEVISTDLVPRLKQERANTKKMRFWSAAASTGQEAYSLAMLLLEQGLADWNLQILGTDFSSQMVERARLGSFQQVEVNRGLATPLLIKHFRRAGIHWQLNDQVRNMVRFETIDLRKNLRALGPFDLVFCRNVLIYFDTPTKLQILEQLHGTLFRGAWLFLGGAETVFGYEKWFEKKVIGNAIVYVAR